MDFGRRLPLNVLKERARTEPDRHWVYIPRTSDPKDGWDTLTFAHLAKAVNRSANEILAFGGVPPPGAFPTIAYIGTNDSRYISFAFGAIKAGYKALFISPRNSTEGQVRLFQNTDCHLIAHSPEFQGAVDLWKKEHDMKSFVVAPERDWYSGNESTHIDYEKTFEEGEWEPFAVLHTSGSSGFPKPIISRQGWFTSIDAFCNVPPKNGVHMWTIEVARIASKMILPMPFFHAAGLYLGTYLGVMGGKPAVLPIPSKPLTADLVADYINYTGSNHTLLPPSILEDMSHTPAHVEALKKLDLVMFGGGNLNARVGDNLAKQGIKLLNMIAATEMPYPIYFQSDPNLWRYFHFEPELGGLDFRPTSTDKDTYQLFVNRREKYPGIQGVFYTFPEIEEYDTKDLFRPHPELKDHWVYAGRADTVIVFSNGEKLNPLSIEENVSEHLALKGVLVVGQDRFQPAIILEPVAQPKTDLEREELIESVWPLIEEANKETVAHGRIERGFAMISNPEKPFLRAGKGTIQRILTADLYKEETDELYAKAEKAQEANAPNLDVSSEASLLESLQQLFTTRLEVPELSPETDIFSVGVDSLQVINATRLINAGLKASGVDLGPSTLAPRAIYSNPTYKGLAAYLYDLIQTGGAQEVDDFEQAEKEMKALIEKYTKDLPPANTNKPPPLDEGQTVVVTGTTGGLGSYLLHLLIARENVKKVICLNRSKDAVSRQIQSFNERGLNADFSKVEFLHADLSQPDFGLGRDVYGKLLASVDRIIHNGWPVNFNIALSTFEPHIRGVRNFVDFSTKAVKRVPIIFISSIGTADNWQGEVPEAAITDFTAAAGNYGRSKQVSSLILDEAGRVSGVPAASIRVGQIAGSRYEKGLWNKQEWLPSIIASSVYLGVLPGNIGQLNTVDWMAIEDVANLVLDVSGVGERLPVDKISGYFHSVNPETTSWQDMVQVVKNFYGDRIKKIVDFKEWIEILKASQETTEDITKNPGIKLIDSYEGFLKGAQMQFAMERTKSYSSTAKNLKAVTPEMMRHWCKQWNF
ncbi:acetyl-CoA synthetase-like protein [Hypoxylon trugodes]|uniref:acetyl-CoA synthetase-like protein n=1 Tax=Hypoxylon trugodes TaxID=326681 RepID=UPI0021A08DFE|nr:acetyl-CoA synthetase-like protein [Hypoxylon trugodes]KAI1390133.1 acetyl-CoA synthetase-like protein [Hypoxylon trugodes]